jgi:hypothetical protein
MMGARVIIAWQGLDQAISRLVEIEEKAPQAIEAQVKAFADDTQAYWRQVTPHGKTGRLEEGDNVEPDGMSFTMKNSIYYFDWVNDGHMTPRGWRTKRGYRFAKRRSHVAAREMTSKTAQFIIENIGNSLSKSLDNI